jgi:pyruvate,orthophosphate dikinase
MPSEVDRERPMSAALLANLEETRHEVVVPPRYDPLRRAVASYFGVLQSLDRLLNELFHPLRNLAEINGQLVKLCGGLFHYFERSADRAELAGLLDGIFAGLYASELDDGFVGELVGTHLSFVDTLIQSRFAPEYGAVVDRALAELRAVQQARGAVFLRHAGLTRRLARREATTGRLAEAFAGLYAGAVDLGLRVFAESVDLERWSWREPVVTAAEVLAGIAGPLAGAIAAAESARSTAERPAELLALPSLDDLLDMVMARARELPSPIERIALYVHLAGIEELQHRNMEILRALHAAIRTICSDGSDEDIVRAVRLITGQLAVCRPSHKAMLYKCLEKLGVGIAPREDDALLRHFVERTIAIGFEGPDIRGVSEEWQTHVNPHHLPCLRTWLAVIEGNPVKYEQLLSALIINLHFEGVFVADTDLFQRDISSLLNSNINDAFNLIMQLVSYFPVFFHEVGSEGELREVSTRLDEISFRRDPVIHFLRKQSHAESNNRLVGFTTSVLRAWRTGELGVLEPYLPRSIFEQLTTDADWFVGVRRVAAALGERGVTENELGSLTTDRLDELLAQADEGTPADRERVKLLVRLYQLLHAKYSYSGEQLRSRLELSPLLGAEARAEFVAACESGDHLEIVRAGNRVLEELKSTVLSPEPTEPFENIFYKRHIAAGIPSMYGTYREPKFDAMNLLLRVIAFLRPHLEALVDEFSFRYMTRESIRKAHQIMTEMLAGLLVSGLRVRALEGNLALLERGIALGTLTTRQYLNIFDFMSEALNDAIETNYISLHNPALQGMAGRLARGDSGRTAAASELGSLSERFLRDLIAKTYAIQEFDTFLVRIRRTLQRMAEGLSDRASEVALGYSPDRLVCHLGDPIELHEDQLRLGYKGYSLKSIKALGFPVPEGFVVSTELFAIQPALAYGDLRADTRERILEAVRRVEQATGCGFGDSRRPLLLSVRSGAPFSMPGMMDTILNVGLNQEMLARMSGTPESRWGFWDCYRRYLQNVAMSSGADRDLFDGIMLRFKERHRVERKERFTAAQMRRIALAYRQEGTRQGVEFVDDPQDQLLQAVFLVLQSWNSEPARLFRQQLQLADAWGTAVIVQQMVFGNMSSSSGSGVVFTRNPRSSSTGISLFGDFTVRSQGEDVVAGLVHPLPVSERQRRELSPRVEHSLESAFPDIYRALKGVASRLINDHRYEHQEIEFTFSSSAPEDLHILQIRPLRLVGQASLPVFAHPSEVDRHLIASGVGAGGGAMCGRVAFDAAGVDHCRTLDPRSKVILLRPDTVPEDLPLVLSVDGLLTARGGFTSHAAVTAKRLGKCCVVSCRELVVDDACGVARIGGQPVAAGDVIAIDGSSGRVYLGEHVVADVQRRVRLS